MTSQQLRKRGAQWSERLDRYSQLLSNDSHLVVEGKLTRMVGLTLEAVGCRAPIGSRCLVVNPDNSQVEAEVVGFSGDKLYLMPTSELNGVMPEARVIPSAQAYDAPVGMELLGRVLDGTGKPIDGKGRLKVRARTPLSGRQVNPMLKAPIEEPLDVGVKAINALLSVGRGQRMGLFAGSGVGKSVLLGMMTRYTTADIVVVGLIGERGREVKEFIDHSLGEEGMKRAVVVAAPADASPVLRLHGASLATTIAEYFRDQGLNVLLLMDSLTRYAQAQREIALAVGEPPATKGYPPSVFAKLPKLVERAGNGEVGKGSITAFYTVLTEGDDQQDPIADASRAILDGHVVLSRQLAESGHYPAIDIEASISRVMTEITIPEHLQAARRFKQLYSTYQTSRDLITIGAYVKGSDPQIDEAIKLYPRLMRFLAQDMHQGVALYPSMAEMMTLMGYTPPPEPQAEPEPEAEVESIDQMDGVDAETTLPAEPVSDAASIPANIMDEVHTPAMDEVAIEAETLPMAEVEGEPVTEEPVAEVDAEMPMTEKQAHLDQDEPV